MLLNGVSHLDIYENICRNSIRQKTLGFCFPTPPIAYGSILKSQTLMQLYMYLITLLLCLVRSWKKGGEKLLI
jgi:hypothetical protein